MVHRRELNGREIVLGNQGALYKNAMTWWDHDTGSVWSQPLGRAILGPLKGSRLELLPSRLTDWASWKQDHPETLALDYEASAVGTDLDDLVIAVEIAGDAVGFPVAAVKEQGVVNAVVGGAPIAVVVDPDEPGRWAVFSRRVDGGVVSLRMDDRGLVDDAGRAYDPATGRALDGAAKRLDMLPGFTSYPGRFEYLFPEGTIVNAREAFGDEPLPGRRPPFRTGI